MTDARSGEATATAGARGARDWGRSFFLHVIAGGIATAAHYAVMYVLIQVGTPPILATTLGFSVGAVTRFLLSYFHVFSPTSGMGQVMLRFVVALLIQMAANSLLLAALLAAGLPVWKAQVVTTVTLTFFTFLAGRLWVFR